MKAIRSLLLVLTIAVAFVTASAAHAAISITWSFDDPLPAIGTPTTVFSMPATLVVADDSDSFVIGGTGITPGSSFDAEYTFTSGPSDPLIGPFEAGDVLEFIFGFFTPAGPDFLAAPGDYVIDDANLCVGSPGGFCAQVSASNLFRARVVVDGQVPEPATLMLLVSGGAAALWAGRRRTRD